MYLYACKTGINGVFNHDWVYTNWVEYCPFPKKVLIFKIEVFANALLAIHKKMFMVTTSDNQLYYLVYNKVLM